MKFTVTAGHSDKDPGATYAGFTEAALMAELRDLVASRLVALGHQVNTDGRGNVNEPLVMAVQRIAGSDVAIELHTNAAASSAASGVLTVSLPRDMALAQRISRSIAETLGLPVRATLGWMPQEQTFHKTLAFVRAGGLVVETFFLSNPSDLLAYSSNKGGVADAIVRAITAPRP